MRRRRRHTDLLLAPATLALVVILTVALAVPAGADQPLFLDDATTPDRTPVIADGTAAVTAFGALSSAEASSSVRATFAAGDSIEAVLLIPDQVPESAFDVSQLPTLTIVTPSGTTTSYPATRREPFVDGESQVPFVRIATAAQTAEAGDTLFTISGPAATRFALQLGSVATPVSIANASTPASDAVDTWLATPPPADLDGVAADAQDGDFDPERLSGPRYDDSQPGRAAGLPMAIAGLAIMAVLVVIVVRARGARAASSPRDPSGSS